MSATNRNGESYIGLGAKNDCREAWQELFDSRFI